MKLSKNSTIPISSKKLTLICNGKANFTVDLVLFSLNEKKEITDTICYQNTLGKGLSLDQDNWKLQIDLESINPNTSMMMIGFSIFEPKKVRKTFKGEKETFEYVKDLNVALLDEETGKEIAYFSIEKSINDLTSIHLCNLEKVNNKWWFRNISNYLSGNITDMRNMFSESKYINKWIK